MIYIYIYIYTYTSLSLYIYIYMYREREGEIHTYIYTRAGVEPPAHGEELPRPRAAAPRQEAVQRLPGHIHNTKPMSNVNNTYSSREVKLAPRSFPRQEAVRRLPGAPGKTIRNDKPSINQEQHTRVQTYNTVNTHTYIYIYTHIHMYMYMHNNTCNDFLEPRANITYNRT